MLTSKTARTGTAALILVGALGFGPGLASGNAAPAHKATKATKTLTSQGQAWNYTGTWTDKKGRTGQAKVSIVPKKFWNDDGKLMMRSAVTTTLQGARGSVPHTKTMDLQVKDVTTGPAAAGVSAASCDILNLVLGPLDLNLLGLEVHLKQVVLDIIGHERRRQPAGQPALRRGRSARRWCRPGPDRGPAQPDPGHPQRSRACLRGPH